MKKRAVAIIWDIEDVTPSISSTFVKGLRDFVRQDGRISLARVYGNFSSSRLAPAAAELHSESFEMVHIPGEHSGETASIISARTLETLGGHPHIDKLLLISGRASLAPLVRQARSFDLETMVICDARKADERLLLLADSFCDFRDLTIVPMEEEVRESGEISISRELAMLLLQEAIGFITENGGLATSDVVKARLKLINEGFDEKQLGFASWNGFLTEAQKGGHIHARFRNNDLILTTPEKVVPDIILTFLKALEGSSKIRTSEGRKAKLPDIGSLLKEWKINYREHGYSQLKKLADAAAKRGLVLVSLNESNYFLDLTRKGSDLLDGLS